MRKIRKKKLIPKYTNGTPGSVNAGGIAASYGFDKLYTPSFGGNTSSTGGSTGGTNGGYMPLKSDAAAGQTASSGGGGLAGSIMGGVAAGSGAIANALGIEQGKAGQIISGIGSMVSAIPGIGQIAGPALQAIGAFTGGGGSVDENTGEVTEASGLTKLFGFGHSKGALYRKSNRIKNTKVSQTLTENLKAEWANNPNVEAQPNVLAAEGGIMRKPVDALVSKGELIYNPMTKKLSKVPGSKGKPNKADDVYARLYEGDVVISNSPTMLMANGKTPALNLEGLVDKYATGGTVKAREAIIKKVVNWQEANKTEPQLYAMYALGTDGAEEEPKKTIKWSDKAEWWTENVALPAIVNWFNRATYDPYGFSGNEFIPAEDRITGRAISDAYQSYADPNLGTSMDSGFAYADWTKGGKTNTAINKAVEQSVKKQTSDLTQEPVSTTYSTNTTSENPVTKPVSILSSATTRINPYGYNKNMSEFAHWDKEKNDYTQEYKDWVNSLTEKDIKDIYNGVYGDMSTYLGKNKGYIPTLAEAKRLMTDRKYGDWHKMAAAVKDKWVGNPKKQTFDVPIAEMPTKLNNIAKAVRATDAYAAIEESNNGSKTPLNWEDMAYQAASILTPLFDREKAEQVYYQAPVAKHRPTGISVDPQLRAINESYAMARYNQANINPNTGAGMAYGLQAATNRAKQMSDVYNWQINAQNELIGKNVDTFNQWSRDYAGIMNDVYDKAAANRAAARNINRQNVATALSNWGQIRKDNKARQMDELRLLMVEPLLQYGYENYDNYLKWKKENGYG